MMMAFLISNKLTLEESVLRLGAMMKVKKPQTGDRAKTSERN